MGGQDGLMPEALAAELAAARAEVERLRAEVARLSGRLAEVGSAEPPAGGPIRCRTQLPPFPTNSSEDATPSAELDAVGQLSRSPAAALVTAASRPDEKTALFLSLFRGREDVHALRWDGRNRKSGYAPACANEWHQTLCGKPQVRCAECTNQSFRPLTAETVSLHLQGRLTAGTYAMRRDETCVFLAADFDRSDWLADVRAFLEACDEMGVPAYLERSRSGCGGHAWIFFNRPVAAWLARSLGSAILTRAMDRRPEVGFASYDRFFPSQDTLPKGGFGNLIALPLQRVPRDAGNSVFVDREGRPYADQWAFLSGVRRLFAEEAAKLVQAAAAADALLGVRSASAGEDDDPWTLPPSGRPQEQAIPGPMPESVPVVQANMLYIDKTHVPPALMSRLVRLAAFANPEFHRAQAMRLSTYQKPRVISCAMDFPRHVALPRGILDDLKALFDRCGIRADLSDERFRGTPIAVSFRGLLSPAQQEAAQAMLEHDTGVLSAATGFGKTVIAAHLIAQRGLNTLVLVHRRQLLDQWMERLEAFLDLPEGGLGLVGGGQRRPTGKVDVALIQSLVHQGEVQDLVADYGQVIVDECHHLPAVSFEQVLRQAKARYIVGLTATPVRKDGHHPIIIMQCGPIRFRTGVRVADLLSHEVIARSTRFAPSAGGQDGGIQELYRLLARDAARNELIVADVLQAVGEGRSPLVLTERTEHLDLLVAALEGRVRNVIVLRGAMGVRQRRKAAEQIESTPGEERVIVATGRYAGEGFDDPRLDTLFLAMPISWRGTLQQYVGRLHRANSGKQLVRVYDYVDDCVPMLERMYKRRIQGYRAMGYAVK